MQSADKLGLMIAIAIGAIKRIVGHVQIFCVGIKSLRMRSLALSLALSLSPYASVSYCFPFTAVAQANVGF